MSIKIIQNTKYSDNFWNNRLGWTSIEGASKFGNIDTLNLPIDGKWVTLDYRWKDGKHWNVKDYDHKGE